jgi:hypothetical protein
MANKAASDSFTKTLCQMKAQTAAQQVLAAAAATQATNSQNSLTSTGVYILYVFGTVSYDDVFGVTHHTTFCMQLAKDLTGFFAYTSYNTAD